MFSLLFFIFKSILISSPGTKKGYVIEKKIDYVDIEKSLILDKDGFYPKNIFLKQGSILNLKIANVLNKDASFTNNKLNIYAAIKPNSTELVKVKFNKKGTYKFICPINDTWVTIIIN